MATTKVLKNAVVKIDNKSGTLTDYSAQVESVTLNFGRNTENVNAMGDNTEISEGTLKTWSLSITFYQQYGTDNIDDIIFDHIDNNTEAGIDIQTDSATPNTQYTGKVKFTSWAPLDVSHGEVAMATAEAVPRNDLSIAQNP